MRGGGEGRGKRDERKEMREGGEEEGELMKEI